LSEYGIAHCQGFIHHQNIRIHVRDHGKGQPHIHAA
jgi:hypothetical protein